MIKAIAFQSVVEVEIFGTGFRSDLSNMKNEIDFRDRTWNENKARWIVRNPRKYLHLPYIKTALEERKRQPELF